MRWLLALALCVLPSLALAQVAGTNGSGASVEAIPQLRQSIPISIKIQNAGIFQSILAATTQSGPTSQRWAIQLQNNNKTNPSDICYIDDTGTVKVGAALTDMITNPFNGQSMTVQQFVGVSLSLWGSYGRYAGSIPSSPIVGTCDSQNDSIGGTYQ